MGIHDFTSLRYTPHNNNTTSQQPIKPKTNTTRSKCSSPPSSPPSSPSRPLPLLSTTAPLHLAPPWALPPPLAPALLSVSSLLAVLPLLCKDADPRFFKA